MDRVVIGKNLNLPPENLTAWGFPENITISDNPAFPYAPADADETDDRDGYKATAPGRIPTRLTVTSSTATLEGNLWRRSKVKTYTHVAGNCMAFDYRIREGTNDDTSSLSTSNEPEFSGLLFARTDTPSDGGITDTAAFYQLGGRNAYSTKQPNDPDVANYFRYHMDYKTTDLGTWKTYYFELTDLTPGVEYDMVLVHNHEEFYYDGDLVAWFSQTNPGNIYMFLNAAALNMGPKTEFRNIKLGAPDDGVFVSKPGSSGTTSDPGHLLFSTDAGMFQALRSGRAIVPAATSDGFGNEGVLNVYTGEECPHSDNTSVMVTWNIIVTSSNAHPNLGGTLYGGSSTGAIEAISNFSAIGTQFIDDVNNWDIDINAQNRVIPQIGLTCSSTTNTNYTKPSIDLEFRIGSTKNSQLVFWTLFRERGMPE